MSSASWLNEATGVNNLPAASQFIQEGIAAGLQIGAQVCVRHQGQTVADFALGDARQGHPLRTDHRMLWLSAGKPLTAVAIARLWEQGLLSPEDAVARHIPEFAANGKDEILVWHLLTHTAAFQPPALDWPRLAWTDIIERICDARLPEDRVPGKYAAYDPQAGWYLLAEIVWRLTAQPPYDLVHAEILEPIGCVHSGIGMDGAEWTRMLEQDKIAPLHDTTQTAREGHLQNGTAPRWPGDDAQRATAHNPGGGALGPARELCRFYEVLLQSLQSTDSQPLLKANTMKAMTRRWRNNLFDESFRHKVDWGLGFIINSNRHGWQTLPYSFGQHAGENTFGHGGMQSTVAFADPDNGVVVVATFNGLPGEPKHNKRGRDFATLVYKDLGMAP